jgi:hypothetical protein
MEKWLELPLTVLAGFFCFPHASSPLHWPEFGAFWEA